MEVTGTWTLTHNGSNSSLHEWTESPAVDHSRRMRSHSTIASQRPVLAIVATGSHNVTAGQCILINNVSPYTQELTGSFEDQGKDVFCKAT